MGEIKHPWRDTYLKNSQSWLLKRTALLEFLYTARMAWTSPSCTLKLLRTCHRPTYQTVTRRFEVYEVVEQIALVLLSALMQWLDIEDPFYCAPAWSKTCLGLLPAVPQPWPWVGWGRLGAWSCWDGWLGWWYDSSYLAWGGLSMVKVWRAIVSTPLAMPSYPLSSGVSLLRRLLLSRLHS